MMRIVFTYLNNTIMNYAMSPSCRLLSKSILFVFHLSFPPETTLVRPVCVCTKYVICTPI